MVNIDRTKKIKMNTNRFKTAKGCINDFVGRRLYDTKKAIVVLPLMLSMLLLFSCTKNTSQLSEPTEGGINFLNPAAKAIVSTAEEAVPYDQILFVPCGNGGIGEQVALSGYLKIHENLVLNENRFTLNYHVTTQGITGLGLTTGEKFEASGELNEIITGQFGEEGQYTRVFTQQMEIVGQHNVFRVNYKIKITITPDGKVTTNITDESVNCIM